MPSKQQETERSVHIYSVIWHDCSSSTALEAIKPIVRVCLARCSLYCETCRRVHIAPTCAGQGDWCLLTLVKEHTISATLMEWRFRLLALASGLGDRCHPNSMWTLSVGVAFVPYPGESFLIGEQCTESSQCIPSLHKRHNSP